MNQTATPIDHDFVNRIALILARRSSLPGVALASRISAALAVTQDFLSTPAGATSLLNARMFFLERLCESLSDDSLRDDLELTNFILEGTGIRTPGEVFDRRRPDGGIDHWCVLWRKIGPRFGVELAMKNQDGKILHGEFFD